MQRPTEASDAAWRYQGRRPMRCIGRISGELSRVPSFIGKTSGCVTQRDPPEIVGIWGRVGPAHAATTIGNPALAHGRDLAARGRAHVMGLHVADYPNAAHGSSTRGAIARSRPARAGLGGGR